MKTSFFSSIILAVIGINAQVVLAQTTLKQPVDLVNPLVDAANSRWFFFNSASRPFGMVNLSPDNAIDADWNAGYRYEKDSIKCFSHVHCWQLSGIPVMPTTGEFKGHLGSNQYGSRFSPCQRGYQSGLP
jgi:putative alpha-1,2-mannosidase